jgi:DNA uptake protein ComE-like DNA-binding protein
MLPDWLSELSPDSEFPIDEPDLEVPAESETEPVDSTKDELPDWLDDFDSGDSVTTVIEETSVSEETSETLEWLGSLSGEEAGEAEVPSAPTPASLTEDEEEIAPVSSADQENVSPNDDTLNTQVPTWLSQIGDTDTGESSDEEQEAEADLLADDDLQASSSWLDQIGEDIPGEADLIPSESEREVLDWLDSMGSESAVDQTEAIDDLRGSLDQTETDQAQDIPELETAKYFDETQEQPAAVEDTQDGTEEDLWEAEAEAPLESGADDLPDWLSELSGEQDDDEISLESAIRQSDHELNDAEMEFLSKSEEVQADNSDWLSKLDEQGQISDPMEETAPEEALESDDLLSGGILDRLNEKGEADQEIPEGEIPRWLEDLKVEEDPQETAVLWLQEFIEKGNRANVHDEIKRYTDELDPGDSIPKWMEDLKNEEDPQTTAMLWLEKFSAVRAAPEPAEQSTQQEDSSDWLAELEREEADQADIPSQESESDFTESGEGWLADLDIDEKLKSADTGLPEWTGEKGKAPSPDQEEEPSWMKATSPLEGDVNTDELAGQQKEVEIPAWLAGYGEGEEPEESDDLQESASQPAEEDTTKIEAAPADSDEYTWVSAEEAPKSKREPLDINKAAISQLESILGISYQVAKGIVHYREKQGPYHEFSDLLKVPEIVDEQTIEILKPEVFIGVVERPQPEAVQEQEVQPKPVTEKKGKPADSFQETLEQARAFLVEADIQSAVKSYGNLVKKKKFLAETITDLQQATLDHPLEINLLKTLGDAYMQSDKLDEALEAYSKAEDLLT